MQWKIAAGLIVVAALSGCGAQPQAAFEATAAHPDIVCQRLARVSPGPEDYLNKLLRQKPWFTSEVVSTDFHVSAAKASTVGIIMCPATLHLATGKQLAGAFTLFYDFTSPAYTGRPRITWQTAPESEHDAVKSYLVAKYGLDRYERWRAATRAWVACVQSSHGLDPQALEGLPQGLPANEELRVLNDSINSAQTMAKINACGMYPPSI